MFGFIKIKLVFKSGPPNFTEGSPKGKSIDVSGITSGLACIANLLNPPILSAILLISLRTVPPMIGILAIDLPGSVSSDNSFSGFISSYFKPPKCLSGCPIGRKAVAKAGPNPRAKSATFAPPASTAPFTVSNN